MIGLCGECSALTQTACHCGKSLCQAHQGTCSCDRLVTDVYAELEELERLLGLQDALCLSIQVQRGIVAETLDTLLGGSHD